MLPERINDLKGHIVQFAAHIENMKDKSIRGLVTRDAELLRQVLEDDETRANNFELEIDEICTNLIAQFQPMAKDLRTILVIYNMNAALERMGDHSVNIAGSARLLLQVPPIKPFLDIPRMNDLVKIMLSDVITSFINEDAPLALDVCGRDKIIDGLRDQILRELLTFMPANPSIIGGCIQILRIAENLERIADLTTNISENILYMSEGKVIKHHHCQDDKEDKK
ncbi:MAG: phosphate signaling complex protein PhoU [Pseudomonadota bacterium]